MLRYSAWSVLLATGATAAVLFLDRDTREQYSPGGPVAGITSDLRRDLPADRPALMFSDVTEEAGIDFLHFQAQRSTRLPEDMGSGAAWGDYDGDGDWDLYLCDIAHPYGDDDGGPGGRSALPQQRRRDLQR